MKQFDPDSIQTRLINYLASTTSWTQIIRDSAITSLLSSIAESEAELARYFEYLLKEAKWQYAQNTSSLLTEASYLGYTPQRKISAIGTVTVSHDILLKSAGITTIFSKDDLDANLSAYSGSPSHLLIPQGTIFTSASNINYIASSNVAYDTGMKYVDVPVIQGIQKTISVQVLGNPFETIRINSTDVEAASNSISEGFFSVSATLYGTSTTIPFTQVEDIYLASYDEYAYEVSVAQDFSSISIKFGNGIAGALVPPNSTINVNFLETKGTDGNESQNFVVTKIGSSLPIQLYCTNFSSILGGTDADDAEAIRGKAPLQYLINGSIITSEAYKRVIESIPYIHEATVYSGLYTDPISELVQNAIIYSAINTMGKEPDSTTFASDVFSITEGKISPLDYLIYEEPLFLHMKMNTKAVTVSKQASLSETMAKAKAGVYETYGILAQKFFQSFDNSSLISFIYNNYGLANIRNMVEAVVDLKPSAFVKDALPDYYTQSFSFDRSFERMKGFSDGVLHALKVQVKFLCAECVDNSRTLFVISDQNSPQGFSVSFAVANATAGYINVCGTNVQLTAQEVLSATSIAVKIANTAIANYDITNPSPGIITISAQNTTIAPPSISIPSVGGTTGVTYLTIPTVGYSVVQYPYIEDITDYDYMQNKVLNPGVLPNEIVEGQTSVDVASTYIPIRVTLDYFSINPADPETTPLCSGTLTIPNYLPGTTTPYLNFAGSTPTELDANVQIQVIAQPFSDKINPYHKNNIIKITEDDVIVEVTDE